MPIRAAILAASAFLSGPVLLLSRACPGQEETPANAAILVYELPVASLQDALRTKPDSSIEELVLSSISCVAGRLGEAIEVRRDGAAGFRVRVAAGDDEQITRVRSQVERPGRMSLRVLASSDYDEADLQLSQERQRLEKWLAAGGLDRLRQDVSVITQFEPLHPDRITWVVRRLDPSQIASNYLLSQNKASREATVPTFTDKQWKDRNQSVPDGSLPPCLLELVALNMHARSFTSDDIDMERTRISKGRATAQCLLSIRASAKESYLAWQEEHRGRAAGAVVDGELFAAVPIDARYGDRCAINGHFNEQQLDVLRIATQCGALPVMPRFVRLEPLRSDAEAGRRER